MKSLIALSSLFITSGAQAHQSAAEGVYHALEHGLLFGLLGVITYLAVKQLNKGRLLPQESTKKR